MKNVFITGLKLLALLAPLLWCTSFSVVENKTVHDFRLRNVDGKWTSLHDYPDAKGFIIVFTCNHCPFAKLYPARLNELNQKYLPLGIPLIAISSSDTVSYEEDSWEKMVEKAQKEHFSFPYLFDADQHTAKDFGAQRTPHAFVIWKEAGVYKIKYNGAVDDNGAEPQSVKKHYISEAVDALLQGLEVPVKETRSIGCQINFR